MLTGNLLQLLINNFELIFIYACFNVSSSEEEEDNIEDSDEEEVHDNIAVNLELPSAGQAIASVTADASPHAEVIAEASPSAKRRRGSSAAIPSSPPTTSSNAVVRQKAAAASKNGGRKK